MNKKPTFGEGMIGALVACSIGIMMLDILYKDRIDFSFKNYEIKDLNKHWKEMVEANIGEYVETWKRPYHRKHESEDYY